MRKFLCGDGEVYPDGGCDCMSIYVINFDSTPQKEYI